MDSQSRFVELNYPDMQGLLEKLLENLRKNGCCPLGKKYSNLLDVFNELTSEQYLEARRDEYFQEILALHCVFDEVVEVESEDVVIENKSYSITSRLPPLESKLKDVFFDNDYDKLIMKIRSIIDSGQVEMVHGDRLSDLLSLAHTEFLSLPGVGPRYAEVWLSLKAQYSDENTVGNINIPLTAKELISQFDFDLLAVNQSSLNEVEAKMLDEVTRLKGPDELLSIIRFSRDEFYVGKELDGEFRNTIKALQEKILQELQSIHGGVIDYANYEGTYVVSKQPKDMTLERIEEILLKDIDNYLDEIGEDEQYIFECRWGFTEPLSTLEEVGIKLGVSRERIRQKETSINKKFIRFMRLKSACFWKIVGPSVDLKLPGKMSKLSVCFENEKCFYNFLNFICGVKEIEKLVRPIIDKNVLNGYFEINGAPCSVEQANEVILNNSNVDPLYLSNALDYLCELDVVEVEGDEVRPRSLKKCEAVACVLHEYPQGLPWMDLARIVNHRGISKGSMSEERTDSSALNGSEYVYLAGRGVYKSTYFIDDSEINIDDILDVFLRYFDEIKEGVIHLNQVYENSDFLKIHDYYVVRHIVKSYGENYGVYFDGKSSADSLGLKKNFVNVTQLDVILHAMSKTNKPMTMPEIARLLKSNSIRHAKFYIDKLTKNEQVVQVDSMLYTTPVIAYAGIDLSEYIGGIQDVLISEGKPVDPSIFSVVLNERLGSTYSKYFYASIARLYAKNNNWFRSYRLYSMGEVEYMSLTDAIGKNCRVEFDTAENIRLLKKQVAVTDEAARVSIENWLKSLNN